MCVAVCFMAWHAAHCTLFSVLWKKKISSLNFSRFLWMKGVFLVLPLADLMSWCVSDDFGSCRGKTTRCIIFTPFYFVFTPAEENFTPILHRIFLYIELFSPWFLCNLWRIFGKGCEIWCFAKIREYFWNLKFFFKNSIINLELNIFKSFFGLKLKSQTK